MSVQGWEKKLNIIRGKNLVGKASKTDVDALFQYIDKIEMKLDEVEEDDFFGTQGWRYFFGVGDD